MNASTDLIAKLAGLVALLDVRRRSNAPDASPRRRSKHLGLDADIRTAEREFLDAAVAEFRANQS